MRQRLMKTRAKSLSLFCGVGVLFQLGACDIGSITTSTTLDGRDAIIQIVRGAILTPIDTFITGAINSVLSEED